MSDPIVSRLFQKRRQLDESNDLYRNRFYLDEEEGDEDEEVDEDDPEESPEYRDEQEDERGSGNRVPDRSEDGESDDKAFSEEEPAEDEDPEEAPQEEPAEEEDYINPLDNSYAVKFTIGDDVFITYANGSNSKLKAKVQGYDAEGFYRVEWPDGSTTNGITDLALALSSSVKESKCVCGASKFIREGKVYTCDRCGRPKSAAIKEATKKKQQAPRIRAEQRPVSTANRPNISMDESAPFNREASEYKLGDKVKLKTPLPRDKSIEVTGEITGYDVKGFYQVTWSDGTSRYGISDKVLVPIKEGANKSPRREWEAEQLNKMLDEISNEPLCNILMYAAAYLEQGNGLKAGPRPIDLRNARILNKYSDLLATRVSEPRR